MKRFLITTADERSWKHDRPVIFLGEWCRRYDRKTVWQDMDAIVAEPYGLKQGERLESFNNIKLIVISMLPELTVIMNKIHGVNHTERYWNILLGHWLQRYVMIVLNRYNTLVQAIQNYEIKDTVCFDVDRYSLVKTDMSSFNKAISNDLWNHILYSKILSHIKGLDIEVHKLELPIESGDTTFENIRQNISPLNVKENLKKLMIKISSKFRKDTDAFIINSYLPRNEELKLQLSLKQVPLIVRNTMILPMMVNSSMREKLHLNVKGVENVECFSRNLISDMLPTCYFEGRKNLIEKIKHLEWPKNPKFIFTSNSFVTDELFKLWVANKVDNGTPYFVGQHGANYGTLYGCEIWPEIITSDRFLSWGWGNSFYKGAENILPVFNFKTVGFKKKYFNKRGKLALIERGPGSRDGPQDRHYEHIIFQKNVFEFFDELNVLIQDQTIVRLHHGSKYHGASDESLWKQHSPMTELDLGEKNIWDIIKQSRVVVYAYDSAGILETMALNIPTVCFWRGGTEHLLPSAKPFYIMLRSVGILADTPKDAANHISANWNNISAWWDGEEVQKVREIFCERYSKTSRRPIWTLRSLLLSEVNKLEAKK